MGLEKVYITGGLEKIDGVNYNEMGEIVQEIQVEINLTL